MSDATSDPEAYRRESRRRWSRSAAGWRARREAMARDAMPVSAAMIDAIGPQPGHALLELAAGVGDTGFLAAELVEPGGTLICSDFVPEMLTAAQERAEGLGLRNVRFKQIDAESIDLDAGSLDGVLCRWGYMLLADPGAALRETRRVLRPGGRLALAAWTAPAENPWGSLPTTELVARGLMERPEPEAPGQYAWARREVIEAALEEAGFVEDLTVERVAFSFTYSDLDTWWASQRDLSPSFADTVDALDPDALAAVRAAIAERARPFATGPEGGLVLPAATWVASATA
jgi:ubiquinone/menaquinone biosynthesis C-methylase UbiE